MRTNLETCIFGVILLAIVFMLGGILCVVNEINQEYEQTYHYKKGESV